jgi:hypothetical protein
VPLSPLVQQFSPSNTSDQNNIHLSESKNASDKEHSGDELLPSNENDTSEGSMSRTPTPTHYFSFDEACKRKPNHQFLDSGTLSVDGAMDTCRQDRSNTHSLKLDKVDLENGTKPNRSPVYEEPEDFATSIAKLRSLLEQRDSKKSLTGDDRNITPEIDQSLSSSNEVHKEPDHDRGSTGSASTRNRDDSSSQDDAVSLDASTDEKYSHAVSSLDSG